MQLRADLAECQADLAEARDELEDQVRMRQDTVERDIAVKSYRPREDHDPLCNLYLVDDADIARPGEW